MTADARANWFASIEEMLEEVKAALDREHEEVERVIHESVLSVQVRDGWRTPGDRTRDGDGADEYEILLSTGGPVLRIWGTLDRGEPDTAEMQIQDWGTRRWERYPAPEDKLLKFARYFYFGE